MIELFIFGALALIFVSAALAPLESLGWWAGWGAKPPKKHEITGDDQAGADEDKEIDFYLVYLSGIGAIAGDEVPSEEYPFLEQLRERLVGGKVITDIYPYSVTNNGLTGERAFGRLWRWLAKIGQTPNSKLAILTMLINVRNVFQLFVSADRRYGPVYNLGIANEIYAGLLRHGYRPRGSKPIVLLGWSGGGQISIGAVTYLAALPGPIYVISLGGLLSDDPGLDKVDHLWHLYGVADPLQAMGGVLFAGRWPIMPNSPWNHAMADGKINMICLGRYTHNSKCNYFDLSTLLEGDPKGRTHGQKTIDTIVRLLDDHDILKRGPGVTQGAAGDDVRTIAMLAAKAAAVQGATPDEIAQAVDEAIKGYNLAMVTRSSDLPPAAPKLEELAAAAEVAAELAQPKQ